MEKAARDAGQHIGSMKVRTNQIQSPQLSQFLSAGKFCLPIRVTNAFCEIAVKSNQRVRFVSTRRRVYSVGFVHGRSAVEFVWKYSLTFINTLANCVNPRPDYIRSNFPTEKEQG